MAGPDSIPEGRIVTLRDGSRVLLRPIRPDDKEELKRGFASLSRESRYRRFFTAMDKLSDKQLAYFTEIDYHDHFAWVAMAIDEPGSPGVAVGRYIRMSDDPRSADIALAVTDGFQGRGLGSVLLEELVEVARANGIGHFVGHVLADNRPMLALLHKAGAATTFAEPGVLAIDFDLPKRGALRGSALYQMLRHAAHIAFGDRSHREGQNGD